MPTLVIAAHPDDEVLGCGGTIKSLAEAGETVEILIMSQGAPEADQGFVKTSAIKASQALGLNGAIRWGSLPDVRMDQESISDSARFILGVIDQVNATRIFTHSIYDLNQDHQHVAHATLIACRPGLDIIRQLYSYEVPCSTAYAFGTQGGSFNPNTFNRINLTAKIGALAHYDHEMREFPHPRSYRAVEARATYWGGVSNCWAAEAFQLIWQKL